MCGHAADEVPTSAEEVNKENCELVWNEKFIVCKMPAEFKALSRSPSPGPATEAVALPVLNLVVPSDGVEEVIAVELAPPWVPFQKSR